MEKGQKFDKSSAEWRDSPLQNPERQELKRVKETSNERILKNIEKFF